MNNKFTSDQIISFMKTKGLRVEYIKTLTRAEKTKLKAQLISEMLEKIESERKRNSKNAKQRARYFKKNLANKECVCHECLQTKTYKEMAIANYRSPKHEINLCQDCLDKDYLCVQLENDYDEYPQ